MDHPRLQSSTTLTDPTTPDAWAQADGSATDRLWLADWRRQIATLYAEVRAMAATDPAIALAHWRAVRERLFRQHPQSPVPAAERATFRAAHFDHDPRLRFSVVVRSPVAEGPVMASSEATAAAPVPTQGEATTTADRLGGLTLTHPDSGADTLSFTRLGTIELPLPGDGPRTLAVFWMAGYAGGLFIPFRDATNGIETYAAGRYLIDGAKGADLGGDPANGTITVDLNFATQPSCAFDPRWACPLAPPENRLDVPIRAGERIA